MSFFSPQARFRINSLWFDYGIAAQQLSLGYQQEYITTFEKAVAKACGAKHAICAPQARVATYLAIKALLPNGGEVILSPNTIADVINMVICAGGTPVFCDIDPATGNLDANAVEASITPATRMIMATHIYGLLAPMDRLCSLAKQHNLLLIEDAAQSFGAKNGTTWAGNFGDAGIYSFGMAKNLMAFWGGMLVTNHDHVAHEARTQLAQWPVVSRKKLAKKICSCLIKDIVTIDPLFSKMVFPFFRQAYKKNIRGITRLMESELDLSRKHAFPEAYMEQLSGLQACVAFRKIDRLQKDFEHRLQCARLYYEGLKDLPGLTLPPMYEDGSHVYNYYPIGCDTRVELRMHMMNCGRDVALQHMKNTADLPAFNDFYTDCPNARAWANRTLMLPNYPRYSLDEVKKNVAAIREYVEKTQ